MGRTLQEKTVPSVLSTALALAYTVPQIMVVITSGTVQVSDRPNSVC